MAIPALTGEDAFVYFGFEDVVDIVVARKLAAGNCRAYAVGDTWAAAVWCDPDIPMWYAFVMKNGVPRGTLKSLSISTLIDNLHLEYGE